MANKKSTGKKTMKRALLMGIISMFLCISTFVGTTFAWFSDSVTSNKNQIVAGNLDVELSYWTKANKWESVNGKSDVFDPNAYWEPGRTEVVYLQISNEGSLAMKYRFTLDIFGETLGRTVGSNADNIRLSDYLQFGFVQNVKVGDLETRAAALAAVEKQWSLQEALKHQQGQGMLTGQMEKGAQPKIFAVVLWMPTTVGNEANCDGVHIPSVDIGVTLVATQLANEDDSFDDQYDAEAPLPITGTGTATVTDGIATEVEVRVGGGKIATALVHKDSIADGAEQIVMTVEETSVNENVTVESDELARTFEVTVTGIKDKEDNQEAIKVQIRIGEGLSNPRVYHYDTLINSTYSGEYIIFETKDFSPFTVVYDQEPAVSPDQPDLPEIPDDPNAPADLPVANVSRATEYENTDLEWESFGGFSPTAGLDNHLEAAYTFAAVDDETTVKNSPYKDWYCDFYVKLDRDLGENQIFLGGNYGSFGWIGFHNGDVTLKANEEIPLLGSVTQNPWTYESIVSFVGTFICGVGDVDDALAGATFTVMLRLTNPENESEYYNVATINYTFTRSVPEDLPVANVSRATEYENTDLEWESFGGFSPTAGLDNHLEAAYTFAAVDDETTVKNSPYKDWYCDFYVKLDRDLGENQIFLGGNYGSFGWIGFHNGDVTLNANEEIPLLGSVTQNPWTYESIVSFVGTFICGVGDVDDALAGATFTVMLRLTNPDDPTEYYNVATINYTF